MKFAFGYIILNIFFAKFLSEASSENEKQTPCKICTQIKDAFLKGLNDTINKTYDSGSYQWEKSKLVSFEKSELRLVEIMESICEKNADKSKCHKMIEEHEKTIEKWFFNRNDSNETLFQYLCIDNAQVCCPPNHFGKQCSMCVGFVDGKMCAGKGTCFGEGTRKGNGTCKCERGYTGKHCEKCTDNHYLDEKSHNCYPCHNSCNGKCVNYTAEGCLGTCKQGWEVDENGVCKDINECAVNKHNCSHKQYCMNVPGSFRCGNCHADCKTCNGDKIYNCLACNKGYIKSNDNKCVEIDECAENTHTCKEGTFCQNNAGGYSCKKCSSSCDTSCDGPGLEGCIDCKDGFKLNEHGKGCVDIDECEEKPGICPEGKYCKNKKGAYSCKKCDEACSLCHNVGPYSCLSCSEGYKMIKGVCKDIHKLHKYDDDHEEEEDDDDEDL